MIDPFDSRFMDFDTELRSHDERLEVLENLLPQKDSSGFSWPDAISFLGLMGLVAFVVWMLLK